MVCKLPVWSFQPFVYLASLDLECVEEFEMFRMIIVDE